MAMSTKLSVAVHILSLVEQGPAEKMTSDYLAASVNTNPVVIRRLMSKLKKAGLLHSMRGTSQTYLLKAPKDISLYDVYLAVELDQDVFSIHQHPNPNCDIGANIQGALEIEFAKVQAKMESELKSISLIHVIREIKEQRDKAKQS